MIPLRDASRTPVRFPVVTVSLIAVNVLAFVWEGGKRSGDHPMVLRLFAHVSHVSAFLLIRLWLVTQMLNQMGAVVEADAGGVASTAHVGAPSSES